MMPVSVPVFAFTLPCTKLFFIRFFNVPSTPPIDLDEEMEYLIINEGRFSSNRNVPLCDVIDVHIAKTFFGLDHCVVIEYGHKNIVTVQPDNEEAFMERIKNK
jgi:hypothetical protein